MNKNKTEESRIIIKKVQYVLGKSKESYNDYKHEEKNYLH